MRENQHHFDWSISTLLVAVLVQWARAEVTGAPRPSSLPGVDQWARAEVTGAPRPSSLPGGEPQFTRLYKYQPEHKPWDTRVGWTFERDRPRQPYRMCVSPSTWLAVKVPPIRRVLIQKIVVKYSYMYEKWTKDAELYLTHNAGLSLPYWQKLPTKVIQNFQYYNHTITLEFANYDYGCYLYMGFDAKNVCVNLCCLEVKGQIVKTVIIPDKNGLVCSIPTRNKCNDPEDYQYFWYEKDIKKVGNQSKKYIFPNQQAKESNFYCTISAGGCPGYLYCRTLRSDTFYIMGTMCPPNSRYFCCVLFDNGTCGYRDTRDMHFEQRQTPGTGVLSTSASASWCDRDHVFVCLCVYVCVCVVCEMSKLKG